MCPNLPESLSYNELGGTKQDYSPVSDATTDRAANEINLTTAATSAMSRTALRGRVRFTTASTTGGLVLNGWETVWKGETATLPLLARSTAGVFTITFPTSVVDEAGESHLVNIKDVVAGSETITVLASAVVTSANVITVTVAALSGGVVTTGDNVGTIIKVFFA